jgi:hypothetical protein
MPCQPETPTRSAFTRSSLSMSSGDDDGEPPLGAVQQQELAYLELAKSAGPLKKPEMVYIVMYNPGTPREGIHTVGYPKGSESDILLAFEDLDECVKFTDMLKGHPNLPEEPVPSPTGLEQIEQACQEMGLPIQVVPAQK